MIPRTAVLALAAALLLQAVNARAQATSPPYIGRMPSAARLKAEVKGADAVDASARRVAALTVFRLIIESLARSRPSGLTPDEKRLIGDYADARNRSSEYPDSADQEKWVRLHLLYLRDPAFRDELLRRYFPAEVRAEYYRVRGTQPPALPGQPPRQPTKIPPSGSAHDPSLEYYNQGEKYRDAKEYAKAIDAFKKSIALEPSAGAYNGLARTYYALKQYPDAVAEYQRALRLAPNDATIRANLGLTYFVTKQYENAVSAFKEVVRLKPDHADAFGILGNAYSELEQFSEAVAAYQQAIRLAPKNAVYHGNLGIAYVEMGRKEEALQVLKTLQRLDPARAKELAEDIDLIEGNDPNALLDLGMSMALKPQNHWLALRLFRRVIVMNRDPKLVGEAYDWMGNIYTGQQKEAKATAAYQQAAVFYEKALRLKPNDADLLYWLCSTYITLNKKQEARQIYSRLQRVDREKAQKLSAAINAMK